MCSATDPNQNCTYELSLLVLRKVSILSYTRQRERQRKSNCKIDSTFKLVSFSWNCVCACVQVSMSVCAEHFSYLVHFICRCSFAYVLRTSLSFLENATIPYLSVFRFMHGAQVHLNGVMYVFVVIVIILVVVVAAGSAAAADFFLFTIHNVACRISTWCKCTVQRIVRERVDR